MSRKNIYLDYSATTPADPGVVEKMLPYFSTKFGNPSSNTHSYGWDAQDAICIAGENLAKLVSTHPKNITWTSGATESNNLALMGYALANRERGNHVITCRTEHKSVLATAAILEASGFDVTYLPVDSSGRVRASDFDEAVRPQTILASIMWANNETGVLHPVLELAEIAKKHNLFFHSDATQAVGKIPIDFDASGIDAISCSAHKLYGPKGVGALIVKRSRPAATINPLIVGGDQQGGLRGGTMPVPLIVGFGEAARIVNDEIANDGRVEELRNQLEETITSTLQGTIVNGRDAFRLPCVTSLSFPGIDGEELLTSLSGIAVSSGSACTSTSGKPSHVLTSMGVSDALAKATIRCSIGRFTTREECSVAADQIVSTVIELRRENHVDGGEV